jgi:hypothetical protein
MYINDDDWKKIEWPKDSEPSGDELPPWRYNNKPYLFVHGFVTMATALALGWQAIIVGLICVLVVEAIDRKRLRKKDDNGRVPEDEAH